jgi:hypothetical protein
MTSDNTTQIDLTPLVEDLLTVIEHLNEAHELALENVSIDFKTDAEVVSAALEFVQFLGSLINGTLEPAN